MAEDRGIKLEARETLTRWGFVDGQIVTNYWNARHDDKIEPLTGAYALIILVESLLDDMIGERYIEKQWRVQPRAKGNPIRIVELGGKPVPHESTQLDDIGVWVMPSLVEAAVTEALKIGASE